MPTHDEDFMRRCLELAALGAGHTSPNPMVGCVIVHEGKVISEGCHRKAGEAHAERDAILKIAGDPRLKQSTLYVNLEPCAHHGKTPPCADLIAEHGIPNVVYGSMDPHDKVRGKGLELLYSSGIAVRGPVLEAECDALNRRFFTYHNNRRPYIILKWAESADGFMAPENRQKIQISGKDAQVLLHKWRSEEDAILIGSGTLITDKPRLNNRLWPGKSPIPIVFDSSLKGDYSGFDRVWVVNQLKSEVTGNVTYIQSTETDFIPGILKYGFEQQILSILVEGGAHTLNRFIDLNIWDEMRVIQSKKQKIENGILAPKERGIMNQEMDLQEDKIAIYLNA